MGHASDSLSVHPLLQVAKRGASMRAQQHYATSLQRRLLGAWSAALRAAAEERQRKAEAADGFARRWALQRAWQGWLAWMDLSCLRRQRLGALLGSLDGSGGAARRPLLSHSWQRWRRAVALGRAWAARAAELAGRRDQALLEQVVGVWAAYARAMRADPVDPDSPFASPRPDHANRELIWDVAATLAGAHSGGSSSGGGSDSSCASSTRPAAFRTSATAPASAASATAGQGSEGATVQQHRTWRISQFGRRLFGRQ